MTKVFEQIVSGELCEGKTVGKLFVKDIQDHIVCVDRTKVSVQASRFHYCRPRDDVGPYSHVEVGYPTVDPPETWAQYADGEYPASVYGYVPVDMVRAFIELHGGEA